MIIEAAVTVYFVGLVNFYKPTLSHRREVIVPLTSSGHSSLVAHQTTITIVGLVGKEDDKACRDDLHGTWDPAGTCTVPNVSGQVIKFKTTSSGPADVATTGGFDGIPGIKAPALCPSAKDIDPSFLKDPAKYAVRLTIEHGNLDACINGKAWVSFLTTDLTTGTPNFAIGTTSLTLSPDAVVKIVNIPSGADTRPLAHFGWYYQMYVGAEKCTNIPAEPACSMKDPPTCPHCPSTFARGIGASGDVGCSNSGYP